MTKAATKLLSLFRDCRRVHRALMATLDSVCRKSVAEYNSKRRNLSEIETWRIHVSNWHPDQKMIDIDVQLWLRGGYTKMSMEDVHQILDAFREISERQLACPKGFKIHVYVQNVTILSEDD